MRQLRGPGKPIRSRPSPVHGAFADASSWNAVVERLQQQVTPSSPRRTLRGGPPFRLHRQPAQPDRRPGAVGRILRRRGHHQRRDQRTERRRPDLRSRLRPR